MSGTIRSLGTCWPLMVGHLFEPNAHYQLDLFVSLGRYKNHPAIGPEVTELMNRKECRAFEILEDPALPNIEYQRSVYRNSPAVEYSSYSLYHQLIGFHSVNQLRLRVEQRLGVAYDGVIRIRPDFKFLSSINLDSLTLDRVWVPIGCDMGGLNDRLAIGPTALMCVYMKRLEWWMQRHDEIPGYTSGAEPNLKIYLEQKGIPVGRFPLGYALRREAINGQPEYDVFAVQP